MIGCLVVIALLAAIIIRVLLVARRAETPFHCYVCVGVAAMLIFQTVVNIGMCLFVMPVIGLTLPFFSYGGSSLLTLYAAMGVVSGIKSDPCGPPSGQAPGVSGRSSQTRPECAPAVFFCIFPAGGKKLAVHPIQYRRYDRLEDPTDETRRRPVPGGSPDPCPSTPPPCSAARRRPSRQRGALRPRRWRSAPTRAFPITPSFWPRAARRGPDLHRGERAQKGTVQIDGASFTYTPEGIPPEATASPIPPPTAPDACLNPLR